MEPTSKESSTQISTEDREELLRRCGVPPRLSHCSFDTWEGEVPGELIGQPFEQVAIWGPVGSGKSHLAIAIMLDQVEHKVMPAGISERDIYEDRKFGNWVGKQRTVGAIFRDLQQSIEELKPKPDATDTERRLDDLVHAQLLVWDDFGVERPTDFVLDRVSLILRQRYNHCRPTIITTNLSPSAIYDFDPRIASRVMSGIQIKREGSDYRLSK